jgi:F-type H+-transporting ATPase subunit a
MASLAPEIVFTVKGFGITTTLLATLFVDAVIVSLVISVRRRITEIPGKLQGALEALLEYFQTVTRQVAGQRVDKIFPWVATFFLYIALSNLIGLLPGFGTIGFWRHEEFVPLLHVSTADLNVTLALAVVSFFATHTLAIRSTGIGAYLKRFFSINPILLFVGLLEIVSELTKLLSLSLRLFGNIYAGEVVLKTMSSLAKFALPIPFLGLEIAVGIIQALIFSMLTMAFMAILSERHEQKEGAH